MSEPLRYRLNWKNIVQSTQLPHDTHKAFASLTTTLIQIVFQVSIIQPYLRKKNEKEKTTKREENSAKITDLSVSFSHWNSYLIPKCKSKWKLRQEKKNEIWISHFFKKSRLIMLLKTQTLPFFFLLRIFQLKQKTKRKRKEKKNKIHE